MLKPTRPGPSLLSGLPGHLASDLFVGAKPVRLKADEVLFLASDPGDGCYRIDEGLLKVSMMSRTGTERILSFMGPGSIVGELLMIDGRPTICRIRRILRVCMSPMPRRNRIQNRAARRFGDTC